MHVAGDAIRLLTRYNVGLKTDPRENRLTAALAALLSESQPLARRIIHSWLGETATDGKVAPRFQQPVGGSVGWVDLQLAVSRQQPKRIWVEAKLGHGLSGESQLDKYVGRIASFGSRDEEQLVLLLVPAQRRSMFPDVRPLSARCGTERGPFVVTWQDLFGVLDGVGSHAIGAPHVNWLRKEVLGYMASENLKPTSLKAAHVKALRQIDEASAALEAVLQSTREKLQHRGWRDEGRPPALKNAYWEMFFSPFSLNAGSTRSDSKARLLWGIDAGEAFAGIYLKRETGGEVTPRADADWLAALSARGWADYDVDRSTIWVGHEKGPERFIEPLTAEAQAARLAEFVAETFTQMLAEQP